MPMPTVSFNALVHNSHDSVAHFIFIFIKITYYLEHRTEKKVMNMAIVGERENRKKQQQNEN